MDSHLSARDVPPPTSVLEFGVRAAQRVIDLLDDEITRWRAVDPELERPLAALRDLVGAGGKRLRPAFCFWAYVGAGGDPDDEVMLDVAAALELLHAFALVHDDVMDGSEMRRGRAAVHRSFADQHRVERARGEARRFGEGAAILVGDFAFVYADQLFAVAPERARPIYHDLRLELCVGQYLDLATTASGSRDRTRADLIERYKSGKYTVERPLHLGAALADRLDDLLEPLSAFGVPLGEAFQLRDDLLGVFGDPNVIGKPVGDDLREGKLTPLIATAAGRTELGDRLLEGLGSPGLTEEMVGAVQEFLVDSGAVAEIEHTIDRLVGEARAALAVAPITAHARDALEELATFVAWRDR